MQILRYLLSYERTNVKHYLKGSALFFLFSYNKRTVYLDTCVKLLSTMCLVSKAAIYEVILFDY